MWSKHGIITLGCVCFTNNIEYMQQKCVTRVKVNLNRRLIQKQQCTCEYHLRRRLIHTDCNPNHTYFEKQCGGQIITALDVYVSQVA